MKTARAKKDDAVLYELVERKHADALSSFTFSRCVVFVRVSGGMRVAESIGILHVVL